MEKVLKTVENVQPKKRLSMIQHLEAFKRWRQISGWFASILHFHGIKLEFVFIKIPLICVRCFQYFFSLRFSLSIQMPKKNIYKQNFLFGLREFWVWIEIFDQILEFLFMMLHNFSNRSLSWRLKKASLVVRNEKRLKMSDLKVFEKLQRLIEIFHDLNAVQWKRFRLRLAAVASCW